MVHVDEGRVELLVGGLAGLEGRPGRGRHGHLGEHVAKCAPAGKPTLQTTESWPPNARVYSIRYCRLFCVRGKAGSAGASTEVGSTSPVGFVVIEAAGKVATCVYVMALVMVSGG